MSSTPPMNEPPDSDETIFAAALQWETPAQRAAYLDEACAGVPERRRRVEELLRASDAASTFLERPVGQPRKPVETAAMAPTLRQDFPEEPLTERPGAKIGRYKLLQQIGEGGCGTVFMAEQEEPVRRRVALKVIKLGMDTKSVVARFEAERQALAMMDHPNIAKVLDAGATDSGRPFFVMELVRGIPITRYCDENKLDTQARLDLFIKVCHAIQHAHQKGIIHRDIKPSNILVTLHDGTPVPKVIDFGIAKATEGRLTNQTLFTAFEQFIGMPAYMSPEQAEMSGLDIDTRSDIYALGVLLYELLTGKTPFDAKELVQSGIDAMRKTIREREPQRPSTRLSTMLGDALAATANAHGSDAVKLLKLIRGDLDWIVMKCLEKDRTRRYETANGLAADLKRHLDNEPVVARPPSTAYRFQKAFRRNKLVFAAGTAVALALIAGISISLWQTIVASEARRQEARANGRLRAQVQETDQARQAAEKAALAETQQRFLAEELLQSMQLQKAEDLLGSGSSVPGLTLLGQMLRKNPSNQVAASRFASAMLVALGQPLTEPLRHEGWVGSAQFSPDGQRVVTASGDKTARVWDARTGQPLTEALRHEGWVGSAQFSPDGQRVVTASDDKTARVWEVVAPPVPVPAWFLDWAEARIGRRFDPMSLAGAVPFTELRRQQESVAARTGTDFYTRIAQWVQADPANRALSPHAALTVPEYVRRRIEENTLTSLGEAVRMSPTNSLAWARLALAEMVQDAKEEPGHLVAAEFSARHAMRLDPLNGEAWRALGAVELAKGQAVEAMVAVERALQFDPANREAWELKGRLLIRDRRPAEALQAYRSALASIPTDPVAAFQVRVDLLEKHLGMLVQLGHPKPPGLAEQEIMRWLVEGIVTSSRRLSGPGIPGLLEPLEGLANSCREAGFDGESEQLLKGCEGELRRFAATQPGDLLLSMRFAALDAWFGREKELAATCSRILEFARNTKDATTAERAAKICSLRPSDERTRELALGLARRAVELGKEHGYLPYFQMALGMAEYRSGHWALAEQAFAAAVQSGKGNPHVEGPTGFYTAVSLLRQGKPELARRLAASTTAKMKPLPKDEQNPLAGDTSADDLIVWLAHKEAMALVESTELAIPAPKATP